MRQLIIINKQINQRLVQKENHERNLKEEQEQEEEGEESKRKKKKRAF